jgi:hypothetical protein
MPIVMPSRSPATASSAVIDLARKAYRAKLSTKA